MPSKPVETKGLVQYRHDVRDTIVKSSLSGVAATVLAVTIFSPAGLGGMIGTSVAAGSAHSPTSSALGELAPFPAPITDVELADIRARLRDSAVSLRTLRASTRDEIAHMRAIAARGNALSIAPMVVEAELRGVLDVTDTLVAPESVVIVELAPVVEVAPVSVSYEAPAVQFSGASVVTYIGGDDYTSAPDRNMQLAALLFAL